MNKKELNEHRDKLPPNMYVILLKPDGEDGVSLAVIDTHRKGDNYVDLSYDQTVCKRKRKASRGQPL